MGSQCGFSAVVLREHRRGPLGGWWQCVCFTLRDHSGKGLFCFSSLMNALALRALFTRRVSANLRTWDSITSPLQEGSRFPQCPCARGQLLPSDVDSARAGLWLTLRAGLTGKAGSFLLFRFNSTTVHSKRIGSEDSCLSSSDPRGSLGHGYCPPHPCCFQVSDGCC